MAKQKLPPIATEARNRIGSRYAQRVRAAGRLPAVVYGHKQEPVHVSLDTKTFTDVLRHHVQLVEVDVGGQSSPCLIKEVQWDHLGMKIIHADLARVDLAEQVEVEIELELIGDAVGLQESGTILDQSLTAVTVSCRADSIPEKITHDISELGVGDSVSVGQLTMPPGVKAVTDAEIGIVHITIVQEEPEEEGMVSAATGAEPEVIGKAETEGEAEEGEGEAKKEAKG